MMKYLIILALLVASASYSEEFILTDIKSSKTYGPYVYSNGTTIIIGENFLTLKRQETKAQKIERELKNIIIPSIEFRDANVTDVINFLIEASESSNPERAGTSLVLPSAVPINHNADDFSDEEETNYFGESFFDNPKNKSNNTHAITLTLKRVSLFDAISIITKIVGIEFQIEDQGIVFLKTTNDMNTLILDGRAD